MILDKRLGVTMETNEKLEEFYKIFNDNIKREGADKLLAYIEKTDYFTAPASARFHNAFEGGLFEHSINVYHRLKSLCELEKSKNPNFEYSEESVAICGLFHDLCKVNYYTVEYRNAKENGEWIKKPFFAVKEIFPYGHGEKSVYIINNYLKLTVEEAVAINWHMGGFDSRFRGGDNSISGAFAKYPFAVLLHLADMQASYFDEARV